MIRLRDRIRQEEGGFTLIELLVAAAIGIVVVGAALLLTEVGARSSARTDDRVEVTQKGRLAMNAITQRVRSQACPTPELPPIAAGNASEITYYTDTDDDEGFAPQKHRLWFDSAWKGGRGALREWIYTADQTSDAGPTPSGWTYTAAPRENLLAEDVTTVGPVGGAPTPFLRYYSFDGTGPLAVPLSPVITGDDLPVNSMAKVVRVDVAFKARPTRKPDDTGPPTGTDAETARAFDFEASVYTRNSDYTDISPTEQERSWGPRCA